MKKRVKRALLGAPNQRRRRRREAMLAPHRRRLLFWQQTFSMSEGAVFKQLSPNLPQEVVCLAANES